MPAEPWFDADDDAVVDHLRHLFAPTEAQPSAMDIATQRRAVLDRRRGQVTVTRAWRKGVAIGAAAALVLAGAGTAAAADRLPPPIEAAANALGLHHEPSHLERATDALNRLRDALARGDTAAAQQAASDLRAQLETLSPEERAKIAPDAEAALAFSNTPASARADDDGVESTDDHPAAADQPGDDHGGAPAVSGGGQTGGDDNLGEAPGPSGRDGEDDDGSSNTPLGPSGPTAPAGTIQRNDDGGGDGRGGDGADGGGSASLSGSTESGHGG